MHNLQALKEEGLTPLAVRVTLDQDIVSYIFLFGNIQNWKLDSGPI